MLRLDEDLSGWFAVAPPEARARGFGRLIRSPTFFEDAVKTITGCNVAWPNTIRMNALLCEAFGDGAFPEPMHLAHVEPERVKQQTKVGYRAGRIVALARLIHEGALKPTELADPELPTDELLQRLKQLPGIGPYAAANLCQLLGRYEPLAIDTETYRHFRQHLGVPTPDNPKHLHPAIDARYASYAPYQFLAYWFELWVAYERAVGPAVTWEPSEHGQRLTGRLLEGTPAPNDDAG
jgi:3-methyladenine DNA glycosylase/8-oxoguanine DNA glycosylase